MAKKATVSNAQKTSAISVSKTPSKGLVKLSIVVPCCNVEKYLEQCLDSIISQTLKEIEIICINDGSKDSTLSIIQKYAEKDSRIVVIDKPNSGYGDSMNKGFAAAKGQYIGIVESDDFIEPDMFKTLYETAVKNNADVVKSNFWFYWSSPERDELHEYFKESECNKVIKPSEFDNGSLFGRKPSIWSAIYKKDFLNKNNISFLPTPGASFQDTSFTFKVYSTAQRMVCLYTPFLHYRQDNENSSVNNADKKTDFVLKEYEEIEKFINTADKKKTLYPIYAAALYDTCIWTYERLSIGKRYSFLKTISPKLKKIINDIGIDNIAFGDCWWKRRDIQRIADNPMEYQTWRNVERYEQNVNNLSYKDPATPITDIESMKSNTNDRTPMFSIIVPIYNVEKYLPSCLDSIVNQTFDDIEIICVCDGSNDHSLSIIEEYASIDSRIRIINQNNAGLAAARNSGLAVARGNYVLFVDSDDYISEYACEILRKKIKNSAKKIDAVLFGTNIFPEQPRADEWYYQTLATKDEYIEGIDVNTISMHRNLSVFCWRFCFSREFMNNNSISFDSSVRYGEDAVFLFNALPKTNCILSISDKLYCYRHFRENSLMNEAKRDSAVYAQHQLDILELIIRDIKNNNGTFSDNFYKYASDFVYGSIESCNENERAKFRKAFAAIIKENNLDIYVEKCPDNYKAYWKDCCAAKKPSSVKRFIKKIIPPSRLAFYDYCFRFTDQFAIQQNMINNLQKQVSELKLQSDTQTKLLIEQKKLISELIENSKK